MSRRLKQVADAASRATEHAKLLAKYGSDGCSGAPELNVTLCCERHDVEYRSGVVSRADADRELRRCMQRKGWLVLPWIWWSVVRLFGWMRYRYDRREKYLRHKGGLDG